MNGRATRVSDAGTIAAAYAPIGEFTDRPLALFELRGGRCRDHGVPGRGHRATAVVCPAAGPRGGSSLPGLTTVRRRGLGSRRARSRAGPRAPMPRSRLRGCRPRTREPATSSWRARCDCRSDRSTTTGLEASRSDPAPAMIALRGRWIAPSTRPASHSYCSRQSTSCTSSRRSNVPRGVERSAVISRCESYQRGRYCPTSAERPFERRHGVVVEQDESNLVDGGLGGAGSPRPRPPRPARSGTRTPRSRWRGRRSSWLPAHRRHAGTPCGSSRAAVRRPASRSRSGPPCG